MPPSKSILARQLRFWSFHCVFNALPSLTIALVFLKLWKSPVAITAMLCAVATFIILYTYLTSLSGHFSGNHLVGRAIRLGAKIRVWISAISLLLLTMSLAVFTPDFWCGVIASSLVNAVGRYLGVNFNVMQMNSDATFGIIYAITVVEGLILSLILLALSFFSLIILQAKSRKEYVQTGNPNPVPR